MSQAPAANAPSAAPSAAGARLWVMALPRLADYLLGVPGVVVLGQWALWRRTDWALPAACAAVALSQMLWWAWHAEFTPRQAGVRRFRAALVVLSLAAFYLTLRTR